MVRPVSASEREGQTWAGVAVDALAGPQVTPDGTAHAADPGSADLGLIMRAQRAGDVVLTRPLFLIRKWAENGWDCIPASEWSTF
jgi:hypothetical protein